MDSICEVQRKHSVVDESQMDVEMVFAHWQLDDQRLSGFLKSFLCEHQTPEFLYSCPLKVI